MAMSYVWVILLFVSVVFGVLSGSAGAVGAAAVQGAERAVELTLSLAGPMIFYSALLEVMERSGLTEKLSRALRPVLWRLFPSSRKDPELAGDLSCNMSANLLGLGNASVTKILSTRYDPAVIVMYQFLIGSVYLLPLFVHRGLVGFDASLYLSWKVWKPILCLAILCSGAAFSLWANTIKHLVVASRCPRRRLPMARSL